MIAGVQDQSARARHWVNFTKPTFAFLLRVFRFAVVWHVQKPLMEKGPLPPRVRIVRNSQPIAPQMNHDPKARRSCC